MSTKHAVFDLVDFKAAQDEPEGSFEAIVSVFGNKDLVGDRVLPGAFDNTLARWREKNAPVPVIWSHSWGDPQAHIGFANPEDIAETEKGLKVKGNLDLDNPFAAQVYKLLSGRRVTQFSFAYEVVRDRRAKDGANELVELDLIEVGPTLKGVNPDTELLAVKADLESAAAKCEKTDDDATDIQSDDYVEGVSGWRAQPDVDVKAGRRISRETETELRTRISKLRAEIDAIENFLSDEDSEPEKAVEAEGKADADKADADEAIDEDLLEVKAALAAAYTS